MQHATKHVIYGKDKNQGYYVTVRDAQSPRIIVTKQKTMSDALWEAFNRLEDILSVVEDTPTWVSAAMADLQHLIDKQPENRP